MAGLLLLAGCSDDFERDYPSGIPADGILNLQFGITPMKTVTTRSDSEIGSVDMYVYVGTALKQQVSLELDENYKASVLLNSDVTEAGANPKFYFVANPTAITGAVTTPTNIGNATVAAITNEDNQLTMSSKELSLAQVVGNGVKVPLVHNSAKITVNQANKTGNTGVDSLDYTSGSAYEFTPYVDVENSFLLAGGLNKRSNPEGNKTFASLNNATFSAAEQFVPAVINTGNEANKSFVVVKALFSGDGKTYFYRLDFQQKVAKANTNPVEYTTRPIDVNPNHHYKFLIKSVTGVGYSTPEEASANPTPLIDYQVHDHSPVIFNMISDGSRFLGVQKEITNEDATVGSTKDVYVKLFSSSSDSEMTELANSDDWDKYFSFSASWLSVEGVTEADSDELIYESEEDETGMNVWGDEGTTSDPNHKGKLYKVTLKFNNTFDPGTLNATMTVNWRGLSRQVDVKWIRKFNPSTLFNPVVELKIFNRYETNWSRSDHQVYSKDYFEDFLEKKTAGTDAVANNGHNRADGLHFPMPYGDGDTKWCYLYKLVVNSGLASSFTWDVSTTGVNGLEIIKPDTRNSSSEANRTFYIVRTNGKDDFKYETGQLILTITPSGGKPVEYSNVKLYHTGFFHIDDRTSVSYIKSPLVGKYLYYEVFESGSGNNVEHWLDRNIGATSAQMHIEGGINNPDARGYYMVAAQGDSYHTPIMYTDACPPGYEVPSQNQWRNLEKDSKFDIEQIGAYYLPTYRVDATRLVYFPKSKYYSGDSFIGEERAGYYWTRTIASGMEKDQIGNWLKVMNFAGTASSFVNGQLGAGATYYMSLRAVAKSGNDDGRPEKFFFQVKGATHVFLYVDNGDGTRTSATDWPGQAIGNYETVENGQIFEYSYETTTADLNKIKVIFNYVAKNGQIFTFSKNSFSEGGTTHTNIRPKDAQGWYVLNTNRNTAFSGLTDDWTDDKKCAVSLSRDHNSQLSGDLSANGWRWNINSKSFWENTGGGDTSETIEYRLGGNGFGGWADGNRTSGTVMTAKSDGTYEWKGTPSQTGEFGIRKIVIKADNTTTYTWISASGTNNVGSSGGTFGTKTNGTNFNLETKAEYTFNYNPSTNKLIVTGSGSGGNDLVKYRLYWKSGYEDQGGTKERNYIYFATRPTGTLQINGNALNEKTTYERSGYDTNKRCCYFDFQVPASVSTFTIKVIMKSSQNDWSNQTSDIEISSSLFNDTSTASGYKSYTKEGI